jgi:predicted DNA-binding transcriptional regulator AlpA
MTMVPPEANAHREERLLPWRKVKDLTGLSRTTAWRLQKAGDFPFPVAISPGRVGWRESELTAWQASRGPRSARQPKPAIPTRTSEVERNATAPIFKTPASSPVAQVQRTSRRRSTPKGPPAQMSFNF